MGALKWPPSEFWLATPWELDQALRGLLEVNGGDPDEAPFEHITRAEVDDLMARFPDV